MYNERILLIGWRTLHSIPYLRGVLLVNKSGESADVFVRIYRCFFGIRFGKQISNFPDNCTISHLSHPDVGARSPKGPIKQAADQLGRYDSLKGSMPLTI